MPVHAPRRAPPLDDEVQVAAADAAVVDLDEDVLRPERGDRDLLHFDHARRLVDGGAHGRREGGGGHLARVQIPDTRVKVGSVLEVTLPRMVSSTRGPLRG